jgi:hypothetical protein
MLAYSQLAAGQLQRAVDTAAQSFDAAARVLRLAAASEGASAAIVARASVLKADAGIDTDTLWPTVALAVRGGSARVDFAQYSKALAQIDEKEAEQLRRVLDALRAKNPRGAEAATAGLSPDTLGQAYSMGVIVLGKAAPEHWRTGAKRLLYASERPYFN